MAPGYLDKDTLAPTFAFIDPFGFSGIPFTLIERLLKCKRSEAFVTSWRTLSSLP